ncbi:MAG: hypothetical protein A2Z57_09915 [Planctomycetes bacterium RIFCSPHIGHO2_12_39_6]|nr:MAG: hypothetical protein A2Z57_09915 [Planctomycetes bacterium RIFCSPHIGHO2_12_39_6]
MRFPVPLVPRLQLEYFNYILYLQFIPTKSPEWFLSNCNTEVKILNKKILTITFGFGSRSGNLVEF